MAATPDGVTAIVNRMLQIPTEAGTYGAQGARIELILMAFRSRLVLHCNMPSAV